MEKKEFLKNKKTEPKVKEPLEAHGKIAWLSNKAFGIIKFILGISLLPLVYSSSISFLSNILAIEKPIQNCFWSGVITFLIIYFFVWEPVTIYNKGHKVLELIFNFFRPLLNVAPNLLPIYTILAFIVFGILSIFVKDIWLVKYFVFFIGFTIALHLIFSAKSIRGRKDFLRANYIFGFSLIYIINIMLLAFCLNLVFQEFSFVSFFNTSFLSARDVLHSIFKQLFLK